MPAWTDLDEAAVTSAATSLGRVLQPGDVVMLDGPMGAGKTTFVRALGVGLGLHRPERVCSPTFAVALHHSGSIALDHVDLCRTELGPAGEGASAAFEALGLAELGDGYERGTARGVLVVEWSRLWADPPADHIGIAIAIAADPARRNLVVSATGPRATARVEAWLAEPMFPAAMVRGGTPPAGRAEPRN